MNAQHYTAYYTLLEVTRRRGIPLTIVIQSIEDAIREAHSGAAAENNTSIWSHIPCEGDIPTAVELIAYLSQIAHQ